MTDSILWIVPKWPLPAEDGARVATVGLLRELTAQGVPISLLALVNPKQELNLKHAKEYLGVLDIHIIEQEGVPRNRFRRVLVLLKEFLRNPKLPLTMQRYASKRVRTLVAQYLGESQRHYSAIVYDGLHVSAHFEKKGRYAPTPGFPAVFYRAHNREALIWSRKAEQTRNPVWKKFLEFQARQVLYFEDSLSSECTGIAAVSQDDAEHFSAIPNAPQSHVVPIGYNFDQPLPFPSIETPRLLFLGRLDWYPNKEGLLWFLQRVWPSVVERRPDIELIIAGSGAGSYLNKYCDLPGIKLLGRVETVEEVYRQTVLALVPIFYGGGTRVKGIEAARYGRACLSTRMGMEGLAAQANKNYFQAERVEDWIATLVNISPERCRELGDNAFRAFRSRFSAPVVAERFCQMLRQSGVRWGKKECA